MLTATDRQPNFSNIEDMIPVPEKNSNMSGVDGADDVGAEYLALLI